MRPEDRPRELEQIEMVRWTASLGAVTAEALAHRTGVSVHSARAKLRAAQRSKLVSRVRPLTGRPSLFTTTRAGLRVCGVRGIHPCAVRAGNANHLIECAATAAALERRYPEFRVIGEHELRRDEREHGHPLASARIRTASAAEASSFHRPDLVLWPRASAEELPVAVEVELTVKAPTRLREICCAWARCRAVAGVIYFASPQVERALLRAIAETHAFVQIAVVPLEALPAVERQLGRQRDGHQG